MSEEIEYKPDNKYYNYQKGEFKTEKVKIRSRILLEAKGLTEGSRNASYGDPSPNMACFAHFVDTYVKERYRIMGAGYVLNDVDGAIIHDLGKNVRIAVNQKHYDNYVDKAAYGAIAGECAFPEGASNE